MERSSTTGPRRRVRLLGWLGAAPAVLLVLLWASASALATLPGNTLNQKLPIAASDPAYQGADALCDGTPPGAAVWHFVLTKTKATSATLAVTFAGQGTTQHVSDVRTGGTLHWFVSTDSPVTLTAASTDARGNRLNLSSICDGGPVPPPTVEPSLDLSTVEPSLDLSTVEPTLDLSTVEPTFDLSTDSP